MKILHVLNHSMPVADGYAVRSANIVHFQKMLGLEPVVLTSAQQKSPSNAENLEIIDGTRHYRTPRHRQLPVPFVRQLYAVRKMAMRIEEIVQIERPDVIHAHSPCLWGKSAAKIAKRHRIPLVYEIRGLWEDAAVDQGVTKETSIRYRLSRELETRVVREATVVTTIAEHLKHELVERGISPDKIHLVPNGVDAEKFLPQKSDDALAASLNLNGEVRVGYIGTLYPWEGVEVMLQAVPKIVARWPKVKFLVVGGGKQADILRGLIEEMRLASHVTFVGEVRHQDVARYYSIMDILVYPRRSTRNTELVTPLKPLEAMAMEKAVLGSDVGGIRELFTKETGELFRAGDCDDFAEKCLGLIARPDRRSTMGRNARNHVLSDRNWEDLVKRYLDIYAEALEKVAN
jgi:PEP-CTERM/exosortase A-associated glycosyltransferase